MLTASSSRPGGCKRVWLADVSAQEAYRDRIQFTKNAQLLTEDKGFKETYFLALGVGLGLLLVLIMVYIVSTPQFVPQAKLFFLSLVHSRNNSEDEYEQYFKYDEEAASGLDELSLSSSLSNRGDIKAKSDRGK